jgi:flagellar hook-associated protein 1 FlgK
MADLLRIATTGLLAYQGSLNTTGHNIANAGVEGYSRQRAELVSLPGQNLSGAVFGNGVDIATVSRIVDQFVTSQLRTDTSVYYRAEALNGWNEQIDALFADSSIGISDRIDAFFGALQDGASDPQSIAVRTVVLDSATTLTQRFQTLYGRLEDMNDGLNTQLTALAKEITALADGVAELNRQIALRIDSTRNGEHEPNDLLDQRDRLIERLAGLVDVQAVADGSAINLYLGKGHALVTGTQVSAAVAVPDRFDPGKLQLALEINGATSVVSYAATGGEVGGLLAFRDELLYPAFNALGRVALALTDDINAQNQLGVDRDGDLGGLVFSDVNEQIAAVLRARPASDNDPASTGGVRVFIEDTAKLTTSDYRLDIGSDGSSWRLMRLQDATLVASGASLGDTLVTVDGFTLDLNLSELPLGNFVAGDSFLIEPTRRGAQFVRTVMSRAEDLALAAPVRAAALTGNLGTGSVAPGDTFDTGTAIFATPGQLSPPLLIRFSSATTFDVLDANTSAVLVASLGFIPGTANTLFSRDSVDPDYFGFQVVLAGEPAAGDAFRIDYNGSGTSDNRNALLMAALQSADKMGNGSATYQDAYRDLVAATGSLTQRSRIDMQSSLAVLDQTRERRESLSGVNLDEEAANLIRFEQAYNASAQVISVARSVLDALFDALG